MLRKVIYFLLVVILISFGACRKDFGTILSSGNLTFSVDTLLLNRVFDDISSSTRSFKVYNPSKDPITIPKIALGKGGNSFYRLNIDGVPGKSFDDIYILPKDSIYVFVEATVDFEEVSDVDFFYRDAVVFDTGMFEQEVKLEALVLDVHLIRPDRTVVNNEFTYETLVIGQSPEGETLSVRGTMLDDHTTFTNEKPYLIYGYVGVSANHTLTIDPGAKLYFHANSGIIVDKGASIKVNGTLGNEVLMEDDRLEEEFENVAGLWETIWLRAGSTNNEFNHTIIKNSIIGILVDSIANASPTLTLKNTQIYNSSNFGLLGRETNILGENVVIGSSGQSSLACTIGGTYNFSHSTFGNFWTQGFRQFPTVLVNNFLTYVENNMEVVVPTHLLAANFTNCIIDGNQNVEFLLDKVEGADFNFNVKNSMLRFNTTQENLLNNPLFDFNNTSFYQNIILNGVADFKDVLLNELFIGQESDAINMANQAAAFLIPIDLLGVDRTANPDIGAYQHIIFEEE